MTASSTPIPAREASPMTLAAAAYAGIGYTPTLTTAAVFVTQLSRSVDFYSRLMGCTVAVAEPKAAILLTAGGFQIYLVERGARAAHPLGGVGVHRLMWAVGGAAELDRFRVALQAEGAYVDSFTEGDITFVEGRDPDGLRVVVAYPGPRARPRSIVASRFYS
jgi:catechol 2,3-dioxygenase-like lactoylglutathione lyase family enzyme